MVFSKFVVVVASCGLGDAATGGDGRGDKSLTLTDLALRGAGAGGGGLTDSTEGVFSWLG